MKNLYKLNTRFFLVTFVLPTNFKPARIKIKDLRNNESKIISKSYSFVNIYDEATAYLKTRNIKITSFGDRGKTVLSWGVKISPIPSSKSYSIKTVTI